MTLSRSSTLLLVVEEDLLVAEDGEGADQRSTPCAMKMNPAVVHPPAILLLCVLAGVAAAAAVLLFQAYATSAHSPTSMPTRVNREAI